MSDQLITQDHADLYANAFGGMNFAKDNAAEKSRRISIEGGMFRLLAGKQEIRAIEERAIKVVIVGTSKRVQRMCYPGTYQKGVEAQPLCWSDDGQVPRDDVPLAGRQSTECRTCPKNQAGSGPGNTKACRFERRLAVVMADDINGDVYSLKIAAQSMFGDQKTADGRMPYHMYEDLAAAQGVYIQSMVTEVKFDPTASVPVLKFKPVQPIAQGDIPTIVKHCQSESTKRATHMYVVVKKDDMAAPPATPRATAAPEAAPWSDPTANAAFAAAGTARPDTTQVVQDAAPAVSGKSTKAAKAQALGDWGAEE